MARSDFWFFMPLRTRYSEVDAQGVVYNAHYLTYYDLAISEYMRLFGHFPDLSKLHSGVDVHTVRAVVEWKAPIHLDAEVEIGVRVARIGRTSMTFAVEIFPQGGGQILNVGEVVWVNTDQKARKAVPFGADLVAAIEAREGKTLVAG